MKHNIFRSCIITYLLSAIPALSTIAGTIDMLTSGYTTTSWGSSRSSNTIHFDYDWQGYGWYLAENDCSNWDAVVAWYDQPRCKGGLKCEYNEGGDTWATINENETNKYMTTLNFDKSKSIKQFYFQLEWGASDLALRSVTAYTTNIVPCTLNFFYSAYDNDKNIVNSDFSYSANTDRVKNSERGSESQINLQYDITATSRARVRFPSAGTYKFSFPVYIKENGNFEMPRVTVNGVQSASVVHNTTGGAESFTFETTVNVASAGTYPVSVWWGNTNEKCFFSTMSITAPQSDLYLMGSFEGTSYTWDFNRGQKMTYDAEANEYTITTWVGGASGNDYGTICFTTQFGTDWEGASGTRQYRYGPSADNAMALSGSLSGGNNVNAIKLYPGRYTIKVKGDLSKYDIHLEDLYVQGNILAAENSYNWAGNKGAKMTYDAETDRYTLKTTFKGTGGGANAYFNFATQLGTDASTYAHNSKRWAVSSNKAADTDGTTNNSVTNSTTASYYVPNGDYIIEFDWENKRFTMRVDDGCINTKTIQAVDYNNSKIPSGSGNSTPSGLAKNSNYYGISGEFMDFKGSNGEIFFPITLSAATYSFTISHANGNNKWFNLYNASGTKLHNTELGNNYSDSFSDKTTSSWALSAGDYYIGLYAEGWAAFEKIVINANLNVFCPTSTYSLTLNCNNNSYGTVASDQEDNSAITAGTVVTITATPASGYKLNNWTVNSGGAVLANTSAATTTFTMPSSDVTITANFIEGYAVTYSAGDHGTLNTAQCGGVDFASGDKLAKGASLVFTATPDAGYDILGWYVDGTLQALTQSERTFNYSVIDHDFSVEVRFAVPHTLTLNRNPAAGGSVSGAGTYVEGKVVSISAEANDGYAFLNWTRSNGTVLTTDPNYNYVMGDANTTLTANFVAVDCQSTYTIQCETDYINATGGSRTTPSGLKIMEEGKDNMYYDGYHGSGYVDFKGTNGSMFYFVNLTTAGDYKFTVYRTNGENRELRIYQPTNNGGATVTYNGTTYYRHITDNMGNGSDKAFSSQEFTHNALPAGDYVLELKADGWAAFDQIVITNVAGNSVFCNPDLFLVGHIKGTDYTWNPNSEAGRMTYNAGTGLYTITTFITTRCGSSPNFTYPGNGEFCFTTEKNANFDYLKANNKVFIPTANTNITTDGKTQYSLATRNNMFHYTIPIAGTYTFTVNLKNRTFTVEGPTVYLIGTTPATSWNMSTNSGIRMTYNSSTNKFETTTWIAANASKNSNGYVSFTTGELDVANNWDFINALRFGPSTDNTVPKIDGSNNAIGMYGQRGFSVPAGYYIVTVNSNLTQATFTPTCEPRVLTIWSGSVPVSSDYTGMDETGATITLRAEDQNWWLQQVVLGPEHFQTCQVGDTIFVSYSNITSDPKGAMQTTNNYSPLSTDGTAYHVSNNAEVTKSDDADYTLRSFLLPSGGYYHIITTGSLAELKTRGVVVKGKGHTLKLITLHPKCDDDARRVNADITEVNPSVDLRDNPYVLSSGNEFDLGEWEHQLSFPKENFRNVEIGDYINVYVIPSAEATVSFRCNVESIIADDKQGGSGCPSYGNISFDRTIDDLDGDAPTVVGSNTYAIITMEVTADMKRRLDETGFIIAGKGSLVFRVEAVAHLFIIGSETLVEEKHIPTVVHDLVIWQGSQATNDDDIDVRGSITYVRPAAGGMHLRSGESSEIRGNLLDHWYTFTVPFEVQDITVYDKSDKQYWGGIQSIYRVKEGGTYDANESIDPSGYGYYYLQWLKDENQTGTDEVFRARWEYVDYETSNSRLETETYSTPQTRYGYPKQYFPYIILFDTYANSYFGTNNEIRFVGGPQIVNGKNKARIIDGDGEKFYYYPNNTLHNMNFVHGAYILNENKNRFDYTDSPVVSPFECYIEATEKYIALHKSINFFTLKGQSTPTDLAQPSQSEIFNLWIEENASVQVYDMSGRLIHEQQVTDQTTNYLELPHGAYILKNGNQVVKVIL